MSTVLHTFPAISRSGHQETGFVQVPVGLQAIQLTGQAADVVLSDPTNSIVFTVYVSPDGTVGARKTIFINYWWGGTFLSKATGLPVPALIDVTFGPLDQYVGQFVQLGVDFGQAMVVGATLTARP